MTRQDVDHTPELTLHYRRAILLMQDPEVTDEEVAAWMKQEGEWIELVGPVLSELVCRKTFHDYQEKTGNHASCGRPLNHDGSCWPDLPIPDEEIQW